MTYRALYLIFLSEFDLMAITTQAVRALARFENYSERSSVKYVLDFTTYCCFYLGLLSTGVVLFDDFCCSYANHSRVRSGTWKCRIWSHDVVVRRGTWIQKWFEPSNIVIFMWGSGIYITITHFAALSKLVTVYCSSHSLMRFSTNFSLHGITEFPGCTLVRNPE